MIGFVIKGNQEDKTGNPIPYHRTTKGSFWDKSSKRYNAWKHFVLQEFWLQTGKKIRTDKPFDKDFGLKARLTVSIEFRGENHADPDNIVKGILDALFENDKHVDVTTNHTCRNDKGIVAVTITYD